MSFGVEASSPSDDQGICLAPATTAPDDEVSAAAYGPRFSHGMPIVRKGSEGLLTPVLGLPLSPGGMAGDEHWLPRGDFGGGSLSQRNIPSRN